MTKLITEPTTEPKPYKTEATAKLGALTELQATYHAAIENEQAALHATNIDLEEQIELIIRTEARRKALQSRATVADNGVPDALKSLAEETMRVQSWVDGIANHETLAAMELIKLNIAKELGMNPGKLSTADYP